MRVIVTQATWDKVAPKIRPKDDVKPEGAHDTAWIADPSQERGLVDAIKHGKTIAHTSLLNHALATLLTVLPVRLVSRALVAYMSLGRDDLRQQKVQNRTSRLRRSG